jgi:uncharacterized membrane protein
MEGFSMSFCTRLYACAMLSLSLLILSSGQPASATSGVTVYTPNTKVSVPPGQGIDYSVDIINNTPEMQNIDIAVNGIPKGWNYFLKSGNLAIRRIAVLPGEKKNLSLRVEVPFQVNKGNYRFSINAAGFATLPLMISVTEKGTFKTEFTCDQQVIEGKANATFTFNTEVINRTADKQSYAFFARAPRGWEAIFKSQFKQVTSVETEPSSTTSISIDINPPDNIKEGRYTIPITAGTSSTSANLDLEVVITGSYAMELSTPSGLLSGRITAGDSKKLELQITNNGSSELKSVAFSATKPLDWNISFEPKIIDRIESGKSVQAFAIIKPDKKAIAGDYVVTIVAQNPEIKSDALFRITVKTPMLWGWIGILIIGLAIGSIYYLFRKYGRR